MRAKKAAAIYCGISSPAGLRCERNSNMTFSHYEFAPWAGQRQEIGRQILDSEQAALMKMRGLIFGFQSRALLASSGRIRHRDQSAESQRTAAELASESGVLERPLYRMPRSLAGELWANGPRI